MNLFSTPTPAYERQPNGQRPAAEPTGVRGWLESLTRTRTPAYTYPAPLADKTEERADSKK